MGEWQWTGGKYPGAAGDKGLQTHPDARFFSISAPLDKPFDNAGKDLVLSYTVKNEQDLQCGGAYIKLAPAGEPPHGWDGEDTARPSPQAHHPPTPRGPRARRV
jgi:calreticulin